MNGGYNSPTTAVSILANSGSALSNAMISVGQLIVYTRYDLKQSFEAEAAYTNVKSLIRRSLVNRRCEYDSHVPTWDRRTELA